MHLALLAGHHLMVGQGGDPQVAGGDDHAEAAQDDEAVFVDEGKLARDDLEDQRQEQEAERQADEVMVDVHDALGAQPDVEDPEDEVHGEQGFEAVVIFVAAFAFQAADTPGQDQGCGTDNPQGGQRPVDRIADHLGIGRALAVEVPAVVDDLVHGRPENSLGAVGLGFDLTDKVMLHVAVIAGGGVPDDGR